MFVIVIMMVLLAVSLPRLQGTFLQARIKGAARDVTGLLRYARDAAVLRELPCEVRFAPETDAYELVLLDAAGDRLAPRRRSSYKKGAVTEPGTGEDVNGVRMLPKDVHFAAIYTAAPLTEDTKLPRVIYYPDGSATPATIAIQDERNLTISVEIFKTTGMAKVEKGMPPDKPKTQTLYYGPSHKH